MNIVFSEAKHDDYLCKAHSRMTYKIEDMLIPFQDDAYVYGLEVGKEKTIAAILVELEELAKQFISQDNAAAADQLRALIAEINDA